MKPLDSKTKIILPWLIAITFFMQMLDTTIVNTALPAIALSLNASPLQMQSVTISYVLAAALLIPASGWFTERFGLRHVFLWAIILFAVGSLACALATSLSKLVIARIIQGMGGALLTPVGRLSILRTFPKEQLVQLLSFITLPALVGPLIGPTLGGILVDYMSWHWIFLINIPVSIFAIIGTIKYMPKLEPLESLHQFDWIGFFLFGGSMVFLTIGVQGIGELHLEQQYIFELFGVGIACLCFYLWHAKHSKHPLFVSGLFSTRNFSIGIIGNCVARLGMSGMPFMIPLFLQVGLDIPPLSAGLALIPMSIGAIIGKILTKPAIEKMGFRLAITLNTLTLGCLIASFALLAHPSSTLLIRNLLFVLFGMINSIQFTSMNTLTLIDLPEKHASSGNSLHSIVMQMGVSVGVAFAATVLGLFSGSPDTRGTELINAFIYTFWVLGAITFIASFIFLHIRKSASSQ